MEQLFETAEKENNKKLEIINEKLSKESKVEEVKIVEQDLKQEFPETFKEEEEKKEIEWKNKMGENMKYVEELEDTKFSFSYRGFRGAVVRLWIFNHFIKCINYSYKKNQHI